MDFLYGGAAFLCEQLEKTEQNRGMEQLAGSDAAAGGSGACDRLCVIGNVCGELCQSGSIRLGFKNFLLKFLK